MNRSATPAPACRRAAVGGARRFGPNASATVLALGLGFAVVVAGPMLVARLLVG